MKIEMNTGNFTLTLRGELSEEQKAAMLVKGMKYELERGVATKVYTALAGVTGKRGKLVLPEGFERERDVKFTAENAAEFQKALTDALAEFGTFEATVSEYIKGEGGESRKRATGIYEKCVEAGNLDDLARMVKYTGDIEDEGEFVAAIHEYFLSPTK